MGDLSVDLKIVRPRVLVQESLPVITKIVNGGSAVQNVPAPNGPSPFSYELRPTQGGQGVRVVSAQLKLEATSPGTPQKIPALPFNLAPGKSLARRDDLADLATKPFAPGTYSVTARADEPQPIGPSAPAEVQIVVPRPLAAANVVDPSFDRSSAFADGSDGFPLLFQKGEAKTTEARALTRASTTEKWGQPSSVAVSVPTGGDTKTSWVAWTADDTLLATPDWGITPEHLLLRATLPSKTGRLLLPGYFFDASGLFFLLDGTQLQAWRVADQKLTKAWTAPVAGGAVENVRLRYAGGQKGEGILQMIAVVAEGGRKRVMLQGWKVSDGSVAIAPVVLTELYFPVLAWYLPVTGKGRTERLSILTGPAPDGRYACLTLLLEKNAVRVPTQAVPALPEPAEHWAMTGAGNGKVALVARCGQKLHRLTLPATSWAQLADGVSAGPSLDLYANFDRAWAEWLDPAFGFRRAGFRME